MKIRNGFVSNSSSSSFIIALPRKITNRAVLKKVFFPDGKFFNPLHPRRKVSIDEAVNLIWKQLREQVPNAVMPIADAMLLFYEPFFPTEDEFRSNGAYTDIDYAMEHARKQVQKKLAEAWLAGHSASYTYVLTFHDKWNNTMDALESGYLFNKFPHISLSTY